MNDEQYSDRFASRGASRRNDRYASLFVRVRALIAVLTLLLAAWAIRAEVRAEDAAPADEARYRAVIKAIAAEIEALKAHYPQLAEFSARRHARIDVLDITYGFRTHEPAPTGGWTSGVPNPNDDGVWFSLDFHDPRSTLEKHRQPKVHERQCIGDMEVQFLSLEGKKTRSLYGPVWKILRKHGVEKCATAS